MYIDNITGRVYDSEWFKKEFERYIKEDKRELLIGEIIHKERGLLGDVDSNKTDNTICDTEYMNTPICESYKRIINGIKNYHIEPSFMPSGKLRSFDVIKYKPIF